MPVIRSQRALAGFTVLDAQPDIIDQEAKDCQDCLPAALRRRAWLQVCLITMVVLIVGATLMSSAEFENEQQEAQEYASMISKLH